LNFIHPVTRIGINALDKDEIGNKLPLALFALLLIYAASLLSLLVVIQVPAINVIIALGETELGSTTVFCLLNSYILPPS